MHLVVGAAFLCTGVCDMMRNLKSLCGTFLIHLNSAAFDEIYCCLAKTFVLVYFDENTIIHCLNLTIIESKKYIFCNLSKLKLFKFF